MPHHVGPTKQVRRKRVIRFAIVSAQLEVSKRAVVPARLRARHTDAARAHGAQGARFLCPAPLALDVRGSPAAQLPRGHPCESDWRLACPRESSYQNAFAVSDISNRRCTRPCLGGGSAAAAAAAAAAARAELVVGALPPRRAARGGGGRGEEVRRDGGCGGRLVVRAAVRSPAAPAFAVAAWGAGAAAAPLGATDAALRARPAAQAALATSPDALATAGPPALLLVPAVRSGCGGRRGARC